MQERLYERTKTGRAFTTSKQDYYSTAVNRRLPAVNGDIIGRSSTIHLQSGVRRILSYRVSLEIVGLRRVFNRQLLLRTFRIFRKALYFSTVVVALAIDGYQHVAALA